MAEATAVPKVDGYFPVVNENGVDWIQCWSDLAEKILTFPLLHSQTRMGASDRYDQQDKEETRLGL